MSSSSVWRARATDGRQGESFAMFGATVGMGVDIQPDLSVIRQPGAEVRRMRSGSGL